MHANQLCLHHKMSCCQAIDVQLGLAIDSPKATLAVKRRLACEMVKCWQQVRIDSISMLVLSCIFFWLCVSWLCRGQGMFSQGLVSTRCKKSWKLIKFPLSKKGSIIDRCHCFFLLCPKYIRSAPMFLFVSWLSSLPYTDTDSNKDRHGKMGYLSVTLNQYLWIYPKYFVGPPL